MYASTSADVRNLPLSDRENNSRSRRRVGYHVYLSRYFLDFNNSSEAIRNKAARALPNFRVVNDIFDEDSDDSATNHNVAITNRLPSFRPGDIMKLACMRWRGLPERMRENWRVRARYLNARPLPGEFKKIPLVLQPNFVSTILESLTLEWVQFSNDLTTGIKRPRKVVQEDAKGCVRCLGRERVVCRNEVVRKMRFSHILGLSLFGGEYKKLKAKEIVQRMKTGVVVHIATRRRMVKLFTMNSMCACECEAKGIDYSCAGKVAIEKNGRQSIGYIMNERDDGWLEVVTRNRHSSIWVMKPIFDDEKKLYVYPKGGCGGYKVVQYWPIRILLRSQYMLLILNRVSYRVHDGEILFAQCS